MKKYLILFALAVLVSCGKEVIDEPENGVVEATPISFDLSATHPDMTKAVKKDWEAGDAIFVFFDNVAAPKHLKMSYDGSEWSSAEYDGDIATPGALGLKNGDTGNMRAVFLPFGSDATVLASGTSFTFSKTYYAYYLTATLPYTVVDNKVSGAFNMVIPNDYVQFFVSDDTAADEACMLGCDAVIPTGVASIAADGTVTETSDKTAADDMPGYSYFGGYLFSGKLTTWSYGSNYYFAKTNTRDDTRHDYFVTGKTLTSHSAVKLPAASDVYALSAGMPTGAWIHVGSGITVTIGHSIGNYAFGSYGKWQTCNYKSITPEGMGMRTDFLFANNFIDGNTLPTKEQFETLVNNCSWTMLSIHGLNGVVVHPNTGFIFLPMWEAGSDMCGDYWSSTEDSNGQAWYLSFNDFDRVAAVSVTDNGNNGIRAIVN